MVAIMKVLAILMALVALDVTIQLLLGGGLVTIQENEYSLIELLQLLFGVLVGFGGTLIHLITHLNQLVELAEGKIPYDLIILLDGVKAVFVATVGSVVDLLMHLIRMPFEFVGATLASAMIPFGFRIDLGKLGHILLDFRTLTFQIKFGNDPHPGSEFCAIICSGWYLVLNNGFGFSFLGTPNYSYFWNVDLVGIVTGTAPLVSKSFVSWNSRYDPITFYMVMQNYVWTKPVAYVEIGLNSSAVFRVLFGEDFNGTMFSFTGMFNDLLAMLTVETLEIWKDRAIAYLFSTG